MRVRALDHLRPPGPPAVDVELCEKRAEGGEGRGGGREEERRKETFPYLLNSFILQFVYISFSMFTPVSCLFLIFFYGSLKI